MLCRDDTGKRLRMVVYPGWYRVGYVQGGIYHHGTPRVHREGYTHHGTPGYIGRAIPTMVHLYMGRQGGYIPTMVPGRQEGAYTPCSQPGRGMLGVYTTVLSPEEACWVCITHCSQPGRGMLGVYIHYCSQPGRGMLGVLYLRLW